MSRPAPARPGSPGGEVVPLAGRSGRAGGWAGLARDVQQVATALMELLAVYPWLVLLTPEPGREPHPPAGTRLPLLATVFVGAIFVVRWLTETPIRGLRLADRQAIAAALAVLSALLVAKVYALPDYALFDPAWLGRVVESVGAIYRGLDAVTLALACTLAVWWRANAIVQGDVDLAAGEMIEDAGDAVRPGEGALNAAGLALAETRHGLLLRFQAGIVGLGLAAGVGALTRGPGADPGLVGSMLGFFLAGLTAVACARARSAAAAGRPLGAGWVALLLGLLGGLVLVGLLVGLLVASDSVRPLLAPVEWALRLIQAALTLVALALGYLVYLAVLLLRALIENRPPEERTAQPPPGPSEVLTDLLEGREPVGLPPELAAALQWLSVAILAGGLLWLTARGLRVHRRAGGAAEETRESLLTDGGLLAQLRRALRDLLAHWRRRGAPVDAGERDTEAVGAGAPGARTVRQVYRELLVWAAARGWARQPAQTPEEYAAVLEARAPAAADDLDALTHLYERARYSARPPEPAEAERAADLLGRVKAVALPETAEGA